MTLEKPRGIHEEEETNADYIARRKRELAAAIASKQSIVKFWREDTYPPRISEKAFKEWMDGLEEEAAMIEQWPEDQFNEEEVIQYLDHIDRVLREIGETPSTE